jgi:hypothetical protein
VPEKYEKPICCIARKGIWLFGQPWRTEGDENIAKPSYLNLPDIGFTSFTPIKGRMDSLIEYIYPRGGLIYMYDT